MSAPVQPPQPPARKKRRPAPKPPAAVNNQQADKPRVEKTISHSRESSDSSGYHEASVLSESPTHGVPSLPRRGKLPSSYSCNNLDNIPSGRLVNSVSTTSLNSNGASKKKKAPPPPRPPPIGSMKAVEEQPTRPESPTEDRCNTIEIEYGSDNTYPYESPPVYDDYDQVDPVEQQIIKPQPGPEPVAPPDKIYSSASADMLRPVPKPRSNVKKNGPKLQKIPLSSDTQLLSLSSLKDEEKRQLTRWSNVAELHNADDKTTEQPNNLTRWNNTENLNSMSSVSMEEASTPSVGDRLNVEGKVEWVVDDTDSVDNAVESKDDSLNIEWEYQLPPPPTDFRDVSSPNYTEFGTVTITPEVFRTGINKSDQLNFKKSVIEDQFEPQQKSHVKQQKEVESTPKVTEQTRKLSEPQLKLVEPQPKVCERQQTKELAKDNISYVKNKSFEESKNRMNKKMEVLNELTNVLNENRRLKEKSLSVSNLYADEETSKKLPPSKHTTSLHYSRSFSVEPMSTLKNFKISTYDSNPSLNRIDSKERLNRKTSVEDTSVKQDVFKKPAAPVEKKLRSVKRSSSTCSSNEKISETEQITGMQDLEKQFLEFLKQKQAIDPSSINLKSFEVLKNILPQINEKNTMKEDEVDNSKKEEVTPVNVSKEIKVNDEVDNAVEVKVLNSSKEVIKPMVNDSKFHEETKVSLNDSKFDIVEETLVSRKISDTRSSKEISKQIVVEEKSKVVVNKPAQITNQINTQIRPKPKLEETKRFSYQGPPSINFATWNERPKTQVVIKNDKDYKFGGHDNIKAMSKIFEQQQNATVVANDSKPIITQRPVIHKSTSVDSRMSSFKKQSSLTNYEKFSALPKKKELTPIELIKELEKNVDEEEKINKVPVVRSVELKKEYKEELDKKFSFRTGSSPVVKGLRPLIEGETTKSAIVVSPPSKSPNSSEVIVPPPPPPISGLKPVSQRQVRRISSSSGDPRVQLLDQIRNFGGRNKLRKTLQ